MQRQYLDLRKAWPNFTKSCSVLGEFVRHSPESRQTPMAEPQGRRTCLEAKSFSNLHHSSNFEIAARPILPAPLERKLETPGPRGPISTLCLERTVTQMLILCVLFWSPFQLRGWACFLSFFTCLSWRRRAMSHLDLQMRHSEEAKRTHFASGIFQQSASATELSGALISDHTLERVQLQLLILLWLKHHSSAFRVSMHFMPLAGQPAQAAIHKKKYQKDESPAWTNQKDTAQSYHQGIAKHG